MVGNGAAELLTWACRSLSQTAQVHVLTPAFGDYWRGLKAFDAKISSHSVMPVGQCSSNGSVLQDLMALDLTDAGLLLNNPHNPTGQCFPAAEVLKLADCASQVVVDEAFMDFFPPQLQCSIIPEIAHYPQVVVVRSLTKFYSIPGLRLGYAIGHPERLQQWQSWRDPWSVNALAIAAGVAALQDQSFQSKTYDWLETAVPQLRKGLAQLPGLTVIPGAVNFALVQYEGSVTKLQDYLLKHHQILIRDCISFPELGDSFFRVAVRTEAENEMLLRALSAALQP
jgi:histidinol-phosphate/aromatic aminotransferase/cobyric acid decarboxylase-like protein